LRVKKINAAIAQSMRRAANRRVTLARMVGFSTAFFASIQVSPIPLFEASQLFIAVRRRQICSLVFQPLSIYCLIAIQCLANPDADYSTHKALR